MLETSKEEICMTEELDVPEAFYKYRSLQTLDQQCFVEAMVLRGEIYFAAPTSFNDPFDLRPTLSVEAAAEQQRGHAVKLSRKRYPDRSEAEHEQFADDLLNDVYHPDHIEGVRRFMEEGIVRTLSKVGLFCVSESRDNLLMWAHYANEHKGVCLVFDGLHEQMAEAQKVQYSDLRIPVNLITDHPDTMVDKALLTKSSQWKYEEEWRLIDHIGGTGVKAFHPNVITGVIIGARAPDPVVSTVRSWAKRRTEPLEILRARISETEFKLIIEPDDE